MLDEGQTIVIGAAPDADVRIEATVVSGRHLSITRTGNVYRIQDLRSSNGTFVDGNRVDRADATPQSRIGLGSHQVVLSELLDPARRTRTGPREDQSRRAEPARPARTVTVGDQMIVLGRDPDCDITIPDSSVSGRHTRVFRNAGRIVAEDMGSRNGTWLERSAGEWESYREAVLRKGDTLRIGSSLFQFQRATGLATPGSGSRVDVRGVGVTVLDRETGRPLDLLHSVSFTALPGEVVGILGPSGSGKTTLMNCLAGLSAPSSGQVLVAGKSVFAGGSMAEGMGAIVGHAPQFDEVHSLLTVEEAVRYSALLRGDASCPAAEVEARVARAIADVDLREKSRTLIGSPTKKTLSGGQRKRVNIAMELVNEPSVLLLDEPTSGLSSHDSIELMRLLRRLADSGRTVILTIHQPSYSAFVHMDQILILEEGGYVAWFGPAAIDSFEFYGVTDREPEALLERMGKKDRPAEPGIWASRYASSDIRKRLVEGRARSLEDAPPPPLERRPQRGGLDQLLTLASRNLRMKLRDKVFMGLALPVPAVVAAIFVSVMNSQLSSPGDWSAGTAAVEHSYLVVLTMMSCFFGALSSSLEIVSERPILRREERGGVGLVPYMLSKAIVYAVPATLFPLVSVLVVVKMSGGVMQAGAFAYWAILAPSFFSSACAGLLFSALLETEEFAILLAVAFAIVQVVFSVFAPLHVTFGEQKGEHALLEVATKPISARWTLGGLVTASDLCLDEYGDLEPEPEEPDDAAPPTDGADPTLAAPPAGPPASATVDPQAAARAQFASRCKEDFYLNHGVEPVGSHEERVSRTHRTRATTINFALALSALLGAGIALRRRDT